MTAERFSSIAINQQNLFYKVSAIYHNINKKVIPRALFHLCQYFAVFDFGEGDKSYSVPPDQTDQSSKKQTKIQQCWGWGMSVCAYHFLCLNKIEAYFLNKVLCNLKINNGLLRLCSVGKNLVELNVAVLLWASREIDVATRLRYFAWQVELGMLLGSVLSIALARGYNKTCL
jgi:hypothetical protein